MKKIHRIMATVLLTALLLLPVAGCGASDGKTHLTFQIWDVAQRDGMQAMCDAYTAQHPDVEIEVQVTSWGEYWTKLEAAAESNTMPDIFWMHTDQILYYADFGILADLTGLYEEGPGYYQDHFSEISIGNASGTDGKIYGIPKDKDNVVLVYNKEMFDAAGVDYPDENWTWDDLTDASQKIYDATGKYGYMAYNDEQLGYWNFVYQNGGYILDPETNLHAGYTQPATAEAIKYYVGLQQNDWCPDQNYFAETSPGTAFFSGVGAMFFEGSWNLLAELNNFPDMVGKWDIAPLPKCPDPVSGDGYGSISNGLCYSTAAKGKNLETVKEVLRFFGSEEGQRIQGESGAAIPAYLGQEESWSTVFNTFDYVIDVQACYSQFDHAVQYINNASRRKWKSAAADEMVKAYSGGDIDGSLARMQALADAYLPAE